MRYWDYIPDVCKSYYARKVLVVGGESTGKTTLVKNLALAYNTNYVEEVGRGTCDYAGGEDYMIAEDLYENLLRQKIHMMDAAKHSNRLLFVDTDAATTLFYANFLLNDGKEIEICEKLATAISDMTTYDLVLFLEPTVEFIQDGTRNETIAADRAKYSNMLQMFLDRCGIQYEVVGGDYLDRFTRAKELIAERVNVTTVW